MSNRNTTGKIIIKICLSLLFLVSCQKEKSPYLRWVGDIEHHEEIDTPDFKLCHGDQYVLQYFNLGKGPVYKFEKTAIRKQFQEQYKPIQNSKERGLIRIRFIVNCEGKAGRFRMIQSDFDYQEKVFEKSITDQILKITKHIDSWEILYNKDKSVDYYMYLIFKIENGHIIEILP